MTIHRHPATFLLLLTMLATGCNDTKQNTIMAGSQTNGGMAPPAANYQEGVDYTIFERVRIMDEQGFTSPAEAFSILVPRGWKTESEVFWSQPGSGCDGTNSHVKAQSPDGKYSIEFLPYEIWTWSDNPELRQMQATLPRTSPYCSFGPPMEAEEYLRSKMGPQDMGNPEIIQVEPTPAVTADLQRSGEQNRSEMMSYGAGDVQVIASSLNGSVRWNAEQEGMVLCGVTQILVSVPNAYTGNVSQQVTTAVPKRIVCRFPAGQKEEASKMFAMIISSFRTNPYWQEQVNQFWAGMRQQQNQVHRNRIRLMDEQTRQMGEQAIARGNQRLADMDVEMRNWEQKQSSQDRIHTEFIKTIRGVENYQDESGKVELSAGYDHAWSRSDGSNFIVTNSPNFDPSGLFQDQQWKEMKKVD